MNSKEKAIKQALLSRASVKEIKKSTNLNFLVLFENKKIASVKIIY